MPYIDVDFSSGGTGGCDAITIVADASGKLGVNPGKGLKKGDTNLTLNVSSSQFDFDSSSDALKIKNLSIVEDLIGVGSVTKLKLGSDFFDDSTINRNADNQIQIKDGGVTAVKLNADVVDNDTVELDATDNFIQVKDEGIGLAKLAKTGVEDKQVMMYDATDAEWKYQNVYTTIDGVIDSTDAKVVTFEDTDIIGGTKDYVLDIYCSNGARYVSSQVVASHTLTVTFDSELEATDIVKCVAFEI